MTLLLTLISAIAVTIAYRYSEKAKVLRFRILCYLFWGASIMWTVDEIFVLMEEKSNYPVAFMENVGDDALLGICVIVLAFAIWGVMLFFKKPMMQKQA
ncbi:MAG: hypothetical protein K6G01_06620 [Eubacterium sp.]|nr:hypothetical protein [Eubacterium sp.]